MTKKAIESTEVTAKKWYFPTLALTVEAETYEDALNASEVKEAIKLAESQEKAEDGDVNS